MTNLRGPMKVRAKKNSHYTLEDLISGKEEIIHIKRIHPFFYDKELVDPRIVANRDKQLFDIQEITEHKGNKYQPSTLL